jgi:ribonuclease HI
MGAAAVVITPGQDDSAFVVGVSGTFSSTRPELWGILTALQNTPANVEINFYIDSQVAIDGLHKARNISKRQLIKLHNHAVVSEIGKVLRQRTAGFTTTKVDSHTGDVLNDRADILAKEAAITQIPAQLPISDDQYFYHNGILLDVPIRPLVKEINRTGIDITLKEHLIRYKPGIALDTDLTIKLMSLPKGLTEKSFRVKSCMEMLPTMERLQMCNKWTEDRATCLRCLEAKETSAHFWNCPTNNLEEIKTATIGKLK